MIDKYMGLGLLHGIFRYSENFVMDFKIYLALLASQSLYSALKIRNTHKCMRGFLYSIHCLSCHNSNHNVDVHEL